MILAAQAGVRGAQKELEFRQTDLARAEEVFSRQLAAPELRDRALVARDSARANLESLEARLDELLTGTTAEELRQVEEAVRQAEARLESIQIDLDRHTARAPVNGIVDSLLFEPGERPSPGQPMAILLAGNQAYARVYVPESLRVRVSPGTEALVYVDGLDQALTGRVRWVASESAFTPYFALTERDRGRLSYLAKIDIIDARERLPEGVPVEVELLLDTSND
jgi:HlyD family secretion protein